MRFTKMNLQWSCLGALVLTAMLGLSHSAATQAAAAGAAPPASKVTLRQVLADAPPPDRGVALAVGADKTPLPTDAMPPQPGTTLTDIAAAFGRTTQTFGDVMAIAPATMTLLNDQPGEPDISQSISSYRAVTMLVDSLDSSQWGALTSQQGLSLSDLTSEEQRTYFWALFPSHTLKAAPANPDGSTPKEDAATDFSDDLPQAHLRLSQTARLQPPLRNGGHGWGAPPAPSDPPRWVRAASKPKPKTDILGAQLLAEVPNDTKHGDLDFDQVALQTPVPLSGLKTVGDLVQRVGVTAHLELYADPHYANRTLTILGNADAEPGGELLRALAFCVTGTFRKVGPAYVLTDNLTGVAACEQIWSEFRDRGNTLLDKIRGKEQTAFFQSGRVFTVPSFGDPTAATPAQQQAAPDDLYPELPTLFKSVPFAQLTSGQQDAARRIADQYAANHADEIAKDASKAPELQGKWEVQAHFRLEALLPSLAQPVEIQNEALWDLGLPPNDVFKERWGKGEAKAKDEELRKAGPQPPLAVALARTPRRAVLAAPHSPAEVASLVAAMRKLGLNQLWLYVFQGGVARVPGTPFPAPDAVTGPDDPNADLLGAALKATKGTGITVLPVLDLLAWGQSAPEGQPDVGILGETSVQIEARRKEADSISFLHPDTPPRGIAVSPFAPAVGQDLAALVQAVAARPHIGGLVWRATTPPGYDVINGDVDEGLGYTPAARLAFLRRFHADPRDIRDGGYSPLDFHLPEWDDPKADDTLKSEWRHFRAGADVALLRTLFGAARAASPAGPLPLLVEQSREEAAGSEDWYGTWDDPRKPLPTYQYDSAEGGDDGPLQNLTAAGQAKAESRYAVAAVMVKPDDSAAYISLEVQKALKNKSWDGIVLDITETGGGPGGPGLRRLAGSP